LSLERLGPAAHVGPDSPVRQSARCSTLPAVPYRTVRFLVAGRILSY
jgi:hypothetical protein